MNTKRAFLRGALFVLLGAINVSADTIPGGDVYGTWYQANSPYYITGNITVPSGDTLTIEPGVDVIFQGYYRLYISGTLEAIGTASDSIRFVPSDTSTGWRGLYYAATVRTQHLSYCDIEYSHESGIQMQAVALNLQVSHCTIAHCRSVAGGGIYVTRLGATLDISHSTIAYNTAESDTGGWGGGIYLHFGTLIMDSCTVHANRAVIPSLDYYYSVRGGGIFIDLNTVDVTISGSSITDNFIGLSDGGQSWGYYNDNFDRGGGIYNRSLDPVTISNCLISGNLANVYYGLGGGISLDHNSYMTTISHCIIGNNQDGYYGAGLYAWGNADIVNCTFYGNYPLAMYLGWNGNAYNVLNTIVAYNAGGIQCAPEPNYNTENYSYNDVVDYCTNMPPGFGVLDTVNHNGAPCDSFFNIFTDPMFVDTANYDFHLTAGSPCIDAGDPNSPLDPDSSISDMGALYYHYLRGDANKDGKVSLSDIVYLINYLFKFGPAPEPTQSGDANCDGKVSLSDIVYLINYLFKFGPPPDC